MTREADPSARSTALAPRSVVAATVLGTITVFLLLVQIASGILLSFYYHPTTEAAHQSVVYVMTRVTGGWLVRSVHDWTAEALLVSLLLYLGCVFFTRAYRGSQRWTWVVGVAFLGVVLGFRFSGDLLPYDQQGYATTMGGVRVAGDLPVLGPAVKGIAFGIGPGEETLSDATLNRFHTGHILLLPWLAFWLGAIHVALRRATGAAAAAQDSAPRGPDAPKRAALLAAAGASFFFGVAVLVSAFWPADLGSPVTRFDVPAGTLPHWSFAGLHSFFGLFPGGLRLAGYAAALAAWALLFSWPWVEPRLPERLRDRLSQGLGLFVCCALIALTASAYRG